MNKIADKVQCKYIHNNINNLNATPKVLQIHVPTNPKNSISPNNKFKAGQAFKLSVKFIGEPEPEVTWSINEQVRATILIFMISSHWFIVFRVFNQ